MKRILLAVIVLAVGFSTTFSQKSNKSFSGVVTYTINYEGDWDPVTVSQSPKSYKVIVKDPKIKKEFVMPGQTISTVINTADSSSILLISTMGGSFYIKLTKENSMELIDHDKMPEVKYLEEVKEIAGYTCKKAEYIVIDEYGDKNTTIVYYTNEISNSGSNFGQELHGLNGFPMEYTITTEQGTMTASVSSVKKSKVKDTDFLIPSNYEEISFENYKGFIGK